MSSEFANRQFPKDYSYEELVQIGQHYGINPIPEKKLNLAREIVKIVKAKRKAKKQKQTSPNSPDSLSSSKINEKRPIYGPELKPQTKPKSPPIRHIQASTEDAIKTPLLMSPTHFYSSNYDSKNGGFFAENGHKSRIELEVDFFEREAEKLAQAKFGVPLMDATFELPFFTLPFPQPGPILPNIPIPSSPKIMKPKKKKLRPISE